jgi:hypothetical protein
MQYSQSGTPKISRHASPFRQELKRQLRRAQHFGKASGTKIQIGLLEWSLSYIRCADAKNTHEQIPPFYISEKQGQAFQAGPGDEGGSGILEHEQVVARTVPAACPFLEPWT